MKKIILICLLAILGIKAYSQLLEDKTNVYMSYQRALFLGNELFNDQGTISPSFYSNLTSNNGFNFKHLIKISPNFSTGYKFGFLAAMNWQSDKYKSYDDSKSTTINFQPVIQIHNKFQENGLYNRLKFYGELSPLIGLSMVNVKNNLFDISGPGVNTDTFKSNDLVFGIETGIGCEYALTNKMGAFANLSVQECFISSPLFIDSRYTLLGLNVGVRVNISKVKRYNY